MLDDSILFRKLYSTGILTVVTFWKALQSRGIRELLLTSDTHNMFRSGGVDGGKVFITNTLTFFRRLNICLYSVVL